MKGFLTKTVRRDVDFVNGMEIVVQAWNARTASIRVATKTGHILEVFKFADPDLDHMAFYPLRVGYASTILRMAGAELEHVTVYLDVPDVAAAGYTALSRVKCMSDIKIGGIVSADHFAPAR